jgi:transposase
MSTLDSLGIDIAKKTFDVALLRNEKLRHRKFANNSDGFKQLEEWLAKQGVIGAHICLEATGSYSEALAVHLHEAGHTVSLVNPARIKAFGRAELQRNKTDRADATLIARFCSMHRPAAWVPPPAKIRELQALVRHLDDLILNRTQLANRVTDGPKIESVIESLQSLIKAVDGEIKVTKQKIRQHLDRHPGLKEDRDLLETIPGISERTATKLLAEIQHLRDYKSARQAAAYAGLSPRLDQSGDSVKKGRLSKTGNSRVRKALFMPAIAAKKHNPLLREFSERLSRRGKSKMVIIGAVMRKLLHLAFGVLKTRKPFDPNHAIPA